jgi:mannosyltransferase OCH1-like enzyme
MMTMLNVIPKRFIRVWIGGKKEIPLQFEQWWEDFQKLHPDYEFVTLRDFSIVKPPKSLIPLLESVSTCAGVSDIMRVVSMYELGGIYVDTDVMPLKNFDTLVGNTPFLAKRSSVSFETAIIGSPPQHPAFKAVIDAYPEWFYKNNDKAASVQTGPAFVSSILFNRPDVRHLPIKTFYPYNGFMAPKRMEKMRIFADKGNFPPEMFAAHFSNHKWGGKPW